MAALRPGERDVLDRFEAGASVRDIAADLELSTQSVVWIVRTFGVDPTLDQHREAMVRAGSRQLLARLRKAGGHR